MKNLYLNTVSSNLLKTLTQLMQVEEFNPFRLVGGTALSLQLGHRTSVDIDLFTDADYESIDFTAIDNLLKKIFPFTEMLYLGNNSFGKSYYIGNCKNEAIKLDLFYTDSFIRPIVEKDFIRMASIEEIAAMKMEVIGNGGRKKDFWDIHELLDYLSLEQMLALHAERYLYSHSKEVLTNRLVDFQFADDNVTPICLKGKYWELIKEDFSDLIQIAK
ncbi:MAG: nucleotidyl transferase AbiEii/AbiGii toxin family protein [Candidatus Azobacteroides sp.]|nr:nucleotidyl transferase AbiEii/AbiGii toxin family protein [Candidatus Azobacteroides sp.]